MIADALPVVTVALLAAAALLTRGLRRSRRRRIKVEEDGAKAWKEVAKRDEEIRRITVEHDKEMRQLALDNLSLYDDRLVSDSVIQLQLRRVVGLDEKVQHLELQLEAQRVLTEAPR